MTVPLTEIFCFIDDFCNIFLQEQNKKLLSNPDRKRKRACSMTLSEIMTIIVLFHIVRYRDFKTFYQGHVCMYLRSEFPNLVSYNRFVELMKESLMPLAVLLYHCPGRKTGRYFIDATPLPVCHNLRIKRHKVFKGLAARGKTSTGWFFGFKLHLVINTHGEIMSFKLTPGNTADTKVVESLAKTLEGWLFGDKGYISAKLRESLLRQGLALFTKVRKNMKEIFMNTVQKFFLSKRGVIETVFDQLKSLVQIQHTRHRSPTNFLVNLFAGLLAYTLKISKPSVKFKQLKDLSIPQTVGLTHSHAFLMSN